MVIAGISGTSTPAPNAVDHERVTDPPAAQWGFESAQVQDEVQVKSSNAEEVDDGEATESDEDDLDDITHPEATAGEITPAAARISTTLPTIKETPNAKATVAASVADTDGGNGDPFSTAQEPSLSDQSPADSPSIRAKAVIPTAVVETTIGEVAGASDDDSDDVGDAIIVPKPKAVLTYGKNGRPAEDGVDAAISDVDGASKDQMSAANGDGDDDQQLYLVSSEPYGIPRVSAEAAKRRSKRKAEPDVKDEALVKQDDEEEIVVSAKRRKTVSNGEAVFDDDQPSSSAGTGTGKLKRPSRYSTAASSPSEGVKPESKTTKRRLSPQVVIPPSSATPTSTATSPLTGRVPKVLLSHDSAFRKSHSKWLKEQGSEVIDDVRTRRTNFVCVVKNDNVRTAKVLRSLALGKFVVTESWLTESKKSGQLLDLEEYVHPQIENVNVDRRKLFHGKNLFFTSTLADKVYGVNWDDIYSLCEEVGASAILKGTSGDYGDFSRTTETICFGATNSDVDVGRLQTQFSCTVFNKSLISHAIISGELDLDLGEFKLPAGGLKKKA